jgi:hypothetical protein
LKVTRENYNQYIHSFANYKLNIEMREQCRAFRNGFKQLVPLTWTRMFGSRELQVVISGDNRLPTTTVSFYDTASALMQSAVLYPKDCCTWTFNFTAPTASPSMTPSRSLSPSPTPCSAPPGYFCSGGSALICPIGAYCAGGSALNVSCYPVTACTVVGLSAQPPCYWNVSTLAGSGAAGYSDGFGTLAMMNFPEDIADISAGATTLVFVDGANSVIREIVLSTSHVSTIAGNGILSGSAQTHSFIGQWESS